MQKLAMRNNVRDCNVFMFDVVRDVCLKVSV